MGQLLALVRCSVPIIMDGRTHFGSAFQAGDRVRESRGSVTINLGSGSCGKRLQVMSRQASRSLVICSYETILWPIASPVLRDIEKLEQMVSLATRHPVSSLESGHGLRCDPDKAYRRPHNIRSNGGMPS
jgi:hypothetical protein